MDKAKSNMFGARKLVKVRQKRLRDSPLRTGAEDHAD